MVSIMCSINWTPFFGGYRWLWLSRKVPSILALKRRFLASRLDGAYDLYAYFEDDLIIIDPGFFGKLIGFVAKLVMIVYCFPIGLSCPFLMLLTAFSLTAPLQRMTCVG